MILSDVRTVMEEAELAFEHIFELQVNIVDLPAPFLPTKAMRSFLLIT